MKKRIILFTTTLVLVVNAICVGSTFSWFTVTNNVSAEHFQTGKLVYTINGEFNGAKDDLMLIVPGDELLKAGEKIYLTNQSTVKSSVKLVVETMLGDTPIDINEPAHDIIETTFLPEWIKQGDTNEWIYTKDEGILLPSPDTPTIINAISSIVLSEKVTQAQAGKFLKFKITFYARQAENVEWDQIALIDYETQISQP